MILVEKSRQARKKLSTLKPHLRKLCEDESGQDLTEYALLLVLIALATIAGIRMIARALHGIFSSAAGNLAGS